MTHLTKPLRAEVGGTAMWTMTGVLGFALIIIGALGFCKGYGGAAFCFGIGVAILVVSDKLRNRGAQSPSAPRPKSTRDSSPTERCGMEPCENCGDITYHKNTESRGGWSNKCMKCGLLHQGPNREPFGP